jgi:hypothetical protein
MYLDEKIEIDEKISKSIFLTNFLNSDFFSALARHLPDKWFLMSFSVAFWEVT